MPGLDTIMSLDLDSSGGRDECEVARNDRDWWLVMVNEA